MHGAEKFIYEENYTEALRFLLHDASEAYLGDMPKPIKDRLPDYQRCEENLQKMIMAVYMNGMPVVTQAMKDEDKRLLELEWYEVKLKEGKTIYALSPTLAEEGYLQMWNRVNYLLANKCRKMSKEFNKKH